MGAGIRIDGGSMATYLLTEDGHRILPEDLTGALLIEAQADGAYWDGHVLRDRRLKPRPFSMTVRESNQW